MNKHDPSIGFIGAGRVGFTLGRFFCERGLNVSGYFSRTHAHACEAAGFTKSKAYTSLGELLHDCDMIFITTHDAAIPEVYNELSGLGLTDKILCHCSGALSAGVFHGIKDRGAYGCSVHPAFAVSDRMLSYREIHKAFFTIEGDPEAMPVIKSLMERLKNPYQIISAENKVKYHAALAMSSNLVIGLYHMARELLTECGFSEDGARLALNPLFLNNAESLAARGCADALTGPVDRNDAGTVKKHLDALSGSRDTLDAYKALSRELIKITEKKYPERDYTVLKNLTDKEKK